MKKALLFMIVLATAAGFIFAGGGSQSGGAGGKIEFWNDKPNPEMYAGLAPVVTQASGIDIEFISYPDTASYRTAIQQTIRQPDSPGLFTWWCATTLEPLAREGLVMDLTDHWKNFLIPKGVSPGLADAVSFDGKPYGGVWNVNYNVIVYHKAIFQRAGVTRPPATFNEFLEACAKIKAIGVTPISGHNDSWGSFVWFANLAGAYDAQLYTNLCNGTEKYTGDRMRAVMAIWKDMLDKGYFTAPNREMLRAFAGGESAMGTMHHGNNVVPLVVDYGVNPNDLDTFILPSIKDQKDVIYYDVTPICIPTATSSKTQALKVLEHWYDPSVAQYIFDSGGLSLTSKINIQNPVTKKGVEFAADSNNYQLLLRFYENTPAELRDVVISEMSRFIAGAGSIDQVLNTIQLKADEVFK